MSTSLAAMQGLGIAQFNLGTNPSSDSDLNELLRDEDMSYNRLSGIMRELLNGSRPKADILQGTGITPEVRAQFFMDELYFFSDIDDDEHAHGAARRRPGTGDRLC